jgi:hypothetical protein
MAVIAWNEKSRNYAGKLLALAEAAGIACVCVFIDGTPRHVDGDRTKMPAHFRRKFHTFRRGIAEILIARGSIRHEDSAGEWVTKYFADGPPRYAKVVDCRFDIPTFSPADPAVKAAAIAAKGIADFLGHAEAAGVALTIVSQPGQPLRLIGTGRNSKAHSDSFYARLVTDGPAMAALLCGQPRCPVPVITAVEGGFTT